MNISKLQKIMQKNKIDLALFYNIDAENYGKNLYYFSGYKGMGLLAIPKNKAPFLIVPKMELERAKLTKIKAYEWEKGKRLFQFLKTILNKKGIRPKTIGIVERDFSLDVYKSMRKYIKNIKVKNIDEACIKIREIKTKEEIKKLRKACKLTDTILQKCIKNFKKFKTEKEVAKFLELETIKQGCTLSFPTIVASGKAAAMTHAEPRNTLQKGFCVIDFGVNYEGYHADITRTIYLGKASKKEKQLYNLLLKTQTELLKGVKINSKCSDLVIKCFDLLGDYKENFTHGLGHGIGLNIHEYPNLKDKSKDLFKNNMVFTIEPGIYFENRLGIRIEDDILIQNNKAIALTKTKKEIIEVRI